MSKTQRASFWTEALTCSSTARSVRKALTSSSPSLATEPEGSPEKDGVKRSAASSGPTSTSRAASSTCSGRSRRTTTAASSSTRPRTARRAPCRCRRLRRAARLARRAEGVPPGPGPGLERGGEGGPQEGPHADGALDPEEPVVERGGPPDAPPAAESATYPQHGFEEFGQGAFAIAGHTLPSNSRQEARAVCPPSMRIVGPLSAG